MENGLIKSDFSDFVTVHRHQLEASGVPQHLWHCLSIKLEHQFYDAGEKFMLTYVRDDDEEEAGEEKDKETEQGDGRETEEEGADAENSAEIASPKLKVVVSYEDGLKASDEDSIYLIDHAWTYRLIDARRHLRETPGLLQRMMSLMGLSQTEEDNSEKCIDQVLRESWKFSRTYSINAEGLTAEVKQPVWYILDEFGSQIRHSDTPSCRLVPFLYVPQGLAYCLLFPVRDLEYGDDVTVDYAFPHQDSLMRQIHLLPWQPQDLTHINAEQSVPDLEYMTRVCNNIEPKVGDNPVLRDISGQLKVLSDHPQTLQNLRHPKFVFVDEEEDADVLFLQRTFRDFRSLKFTWSQFHEAAKLQEFAEHKRGCT